MRVCLGGKIRENVGQVKAGGEASIGEYGKNTFSFSVSFYFSTLFHRGLELFQFFLAMALFGIPSGKKWKYAVLSTIITG